MTYLDLKESFINPPDEFTPIPLWFWNDELTEQEIIKQILDFKDKGVNGIRYPSENRFTGKYKVSFG